MKSYQVIVLLFSSAQMLWGALNTNSSTVTMKVYEEGAEKLIVYTDVPGHTNSVIKGYPSRAKSDVYEIRVRSAATFSAATGSNEWVQCFANMTYNRGREMPVMSVFETATASHAYQKFTAGWTHTYANIEMRTNSPVEVEIRKIGTTLLNSSNVIFKSAVHPAHKVSSQSNHLGRVYFTLTNPCQVVIDINGQMDDHNAAFPSGTPGGAMPGNPPVHSVALYANPIMAKPVAGPSNTIITVIPSQSSPTSRLSPPNPATYNTLVFAPGVHFVGHGFAVHPGKSYYIPGDAIVYGNLSNEEAVAGSFRCSGDRINIYGYGTICGILTPHYQNRTDDDTTTGTPNPEYPEWFSDSPDFTLTDVGIRIEQAWDTTITGVTIIDPANFNTKFDIYLQSVNSQNMVRWVKLHSWRVNGDGFGGYSKVEDSFIRASDDSTYVRNWRIRCTFWKDSNANIFRFVNYISGGLEDCDILYSRWRDTRGVGSVFAFDGYQGSQPPVMTFKNLRFHDQLSNPKRIINLETTNYTFSNLKFENISFYTPLNNYLSIIGGSAAAPYTGAVMFKNITFQNGLDGSSPVRLNQGNYTSYFITSAFVDPSIFEPPPPGGPTPIIINAIDFDLESHPADNNKVRKEATNVGYILNETWIAIEGIDFGNGVSSFTANASSATAGGTIELRLANPAGTRIGSVVVANTGGWGNYAPFSTTALQPVTGIQDLYLVFVGAPTGYLLNVESFIIEPTTGNVTLTTNGVNGSITLNPPGGTYATGTVVTVTAVANSGYTFGNWSGDLTGVANPTNITMNGNKSVTANFALIPTYTLATSGTNGSITLNPATGPYATGTVVTVSAVPDAGYSFTGWSGGLTGSINPTNILMNGNKSVTASFTPKPLVAAIRLIGSGPGFEITASSLEPTWAYELQGITALTLPWTNAGNLKSNVTVAIWTNTPSPAEPTKFFRVIKRD